MDESIGKRIKDLRLKREYTQKQLADLLLISYQSVSKWENNLCNPDISAILELSDIFNVTTDFLIKGPSGNNLKKKKKEQKNNDEKKANNLYCMKKCFKVISQQAQDYIKLNYKPNTYHSVMGFLGGKKYKNKECSPNDVKKFVDWFFSKFSEKRPYINDYRKEVIEIICYCFSIRFNNSQLFQLKDSVIWK